VFSVTPDAPANAPFQSAPSRPARSDQPAGNDIFAALVDSNASTDNTPAPAQDPSSPSRRPDDTPAPADNRGSQNTTATDQTAGNGPDNSNTSTAQPSDANAGGNSDAAQQPTAKSGASKSGDTKSTAKASSDSSDTAAQSSTDPTASALLTGQIVTTPDAVAVVIPVAVALVNVPAASPASGNPAAPLAIAAAAIAASTSTTAAAAALPAQADPGAAATAAAATATSSDVTAGTKAEIQTAASNVVAVSAVAQATQPDTTTTTPADVALVTTVAAKTPVAAKATFKASVVASVGSVTSDEADVTTGPTDPSATGVSTGAANTGLTQQLAAAAKQKTADGVAEPTNTADLAGPDSASTHEHSVLATAANVLTGASDAGLQAASAIQPQLQTAAATAVSVTTAGLTATVAGPVPLSGLALEIAASAQSGKSRFEIRLDPADLGRIDVRIDVDRNGQVTSHLTVEKPETLSMLQQDAPQLQRALDDAGLRTGSNGLQFSLRDQSSSGQNDSGSRNAQRLVISDENIIPAVVAGQTYGRPPGSGSGVDIRV
jgi:flagellar hook-length control protein FliK